MKNKIINIKNMVFNPKFRTLCKDDSETQLRKKEAEVLALLCARYPEPVSREDFLVEIWGGGYLSPQSIAQIIRSLRLNLNDEEKKIIITIPKLGYKLNVAPKCETETCAERECSINRDIASLSKITETGDKKSCTDNMESTGENLISTIMHFVNIIPFLSAKKRSARQ